VARAYFRLLSYKDEYEVARLHTQTGFVGRVREDFGDKAKLRFHLAPPFLGGKRDARGRPVKREFGGWILPLFRVLAKLRGLRGTAFDIFGYGADRRLERQLITEFEDTIEQVLKTLDAGNREQCEAVIVEYLEIRGYGPVKEAAAAEARAKISAILADLEQPGAQAA
jgi:indolepyruvate ferredoxin oxidoreductase